MVELAMLGKTGLRVSRLGAGLNEIGRQLTSNDVAQAGLVLNTALDAGINFLDTAACYGISEEMIGQTISHRRQEYILATKVGHVTGGYRGAPWTAQTIRDSIDRSLKLMQTDYLDLLQIHAYDLKGPAPEDVIEAVLSAKRAGKTRFVGYSQENEEAEWAVESGLFDTLQTAFSLVDQKARYGLLKRAKTKAMGTIIKRPIANAVWGQVFASGGSSTDLVTEKLRDRATAMMALGPLSGAPQDPIELALGFVLAHPEVDTAIVGTRNPGHMLNNIDIVKNRLPLSKNTVDELYRRYDAVGQCWRSIDAL